MKILITGSEGYIGSVLGPHLVAHGFEVSGIDAGYYSTSLLYRPSSNTPITIRKDTRDLSVSDLEGYDAVVQMADLSNDPLGENDPEITYDINYHGTMNVAHLAKRAGVKRFVYMSSCSVYGIVEGDTPVDEHSPVNPQTTYAKCKRMVEEAMAQIADKDFSPVYLRNSTVFGPSPRVRLDLVLNIFCALAFTRGKISVVNEGTAWRPLIHVFDICRTIETVLTAPRESIHNEIFNVGSNNQNYQIKDLAELFKQVFPDCQIEHQNVVDDTRSYRVNFDKLAKTFPELSHMKGAIEGMRELRSLFEAVSLTGEQYDSKDYVRIRQLKHLIRSNEIDNHFRYISL